MDRLARGYFENAECSLYQPGCKLPWNKPLLGRDMSRASLSWAQAAGGAIANARDVSRWARALFEGDVVERPQQKEWLSLVSERTGQPIDDVSASDPKGFALGLARVWHDGSAFWFYEGMTFGFRTVYVWFEADKMVVTVQTNSQPPEGQDRIVDAVMAIHAAVKR
jgi:D-alanyl-D-alanine carboxypeptidase